MVQRLKIFRNYEFTLQGLWCNQVLNSRVSRVQGKQGVERVQGVNKGLKRSSVTARSVPILQTGSSAIFIENFHLYQQLSTSIVVIYFIIYLEVSGWYNWKSPSKIIFKCEITAKTRNSDYATRYQIHNCFHPSLNFVSPTFLRWFVGADKFASLPEKWGKNA